MKSQITESVINALGNPNFDSEKVFEAFKYAPKNSSTMALLNVLPDLEKLAKLHYGDAPNLGRKK
jgi:hypothetical protein